MASTVLVRGGDALSYDVQIDGWYGYIDSGGYSSGQQDALTEALMKAQREEFDALLSDGCTWLPRSCEVTGPVGTDLEAALEAVCPGQREDLVDDVMALARDRAEARFGVIELEVIGQ